MICLVNCRIPEYSRKEWRERGMVCTICLMSPEEVRSIMDHAGRELLARELRGLKGAGMQNVKVKTGELLLKLRANRASHKGDFEKAMVAFRAKAIEELDASIKRAREGGNISLYIGIPQPEEHTKDYDRVITMLEMAVDEVIEIPEADFRMYVMDEWGWAASFARNTKSYSG